MQIWRISHEERHNVWGEFYLWHRIQSGLSACCQITMRLEYTCLFLNVRLSIGRVVALRCSHFLSGWQMVPSSFSLTTNTHWEVADNLLQKGGAPTGPRNVCVYMCACVRTMHSYPVCTWPRVYGDSSFNLRLNTNNHRVQPHVAAPLRGPDSCQSLCWPVNVPLVGTVIQSNCINIEYLMLLIFAYWRNPRAKFRSGSKDWQYQIP